MISINDLMQKLDSGINSEAVIDLLQKIFDRLDSIDARLSIIQAHTMPLNHQSEKEIKIEMEQYEKPTRQMGI